MPRNSKPRPDSPLCPNCGKGSPRVSGLCAQCEGDPTPEEIAERAEQVRKERDYSRKGYGFRYRHPKVYRTPKLD